VQAIVFDFDGTIFDTETVSYDAVADVYASHQRQLDPVWWATMIGTTVDATDAAIVRLANDVGLDVSFVMIETRARVRELLRSARPRPGVEALVKECQAEGVPLAIATSAPRDWVEHHLSNLGLLTDFPVMVPVDEVTFAKPHPEPYITACRLLDADPRWSVAIEDSLPGVASAVAAGLFTLGVASHLTRHQGLAHAHQQHDSLEGVHLADLHRVIQTRSS
jgi:HAD superfamily hydrolase (TIGR01509 family)